MNFFTGTYRSLTAESLKMKNTWAFWSAILAPLFVAFVNYMIFFSKEELLLNAEGDAWIKYYNNAINIWTIVFVPMFIAGLTFLLQYPEHKNNGWKYLLSMPMPRGSVYLAKLITGLTLLFLALAFFSFLLIGGAFWLNAIYPEVVGSPSVIIEPVLTIMLKVFGAALFIFSIQFVLSMHVSNFFFPIGLGVLGSIFSMMLLQWENIVYVPWAFPFFAGNGAVQFNRQIYYSLGGFTLICLIGYLYTVKRNYT